jgi:hypothetical protein
MNKQVQITDHVLMEFSDSMTDAAIEKIKQQFIKDVSTAILAQSDEGDE